MTVRSRPLLVPALVATLTLGPTACGGGDDPEPAPAVHTADNGDVYNDADAAFATSLVEQHAVTLTLVDLARTRSASTEVTAASEDLLATLGPEIEQATDWLLVWDLPVPETIRDHANVPHGQEVVRYDDPELQELAGLDGAAFDERWLELVAARRAAAVDLAEAEVDEGRYEPAVNLARAMLER